MTNKDFLRSFGTFASRKIHAQTEACKRAKFFPTLLNITVQINFLLDRFCVEYIKA